MNFGHRTPMATHASATAKSSPTTDGVQCPQEQLWQLTLLTAFLNTCSLTSHLMPFAVLPAFSCAFTLFDVKLQHGIPGPSLLMIYVKLMMMFRMSSMLYSTARTPMWFLFAGDLHPYLLRQLRRIFLFCTRTTTNSIFSYMN